MEKLKFMVISLGCDKNKVDSEVVLGDIKNDFDITSNIEKANILMINTCGFIESAKEESINTIIHGGKYKNKSLKLLIVTGCLSQRYGKELMDEMDEIDLLFGVNDYDKIRLAINEFSHNRKKQMFNSKTATSVLEGERFIEDGRRSANLKISEGCNKNCSYCAIPSIRGRYISRPIENIIKEAEKLVERGIYELNIVAQDTTVYGTDIYGEKKLDELLNKLSKIENLRWIRLFYCYPEEIYDRLIEEIKNNKKIVKYIDIPIQHVSDNMLLKMRRKGSTGEIFNLISKLRNNIENIRIRTTLLIGFPGETNEDFKELIEFIKEVKFDWLGVFKYSREEGTLAYNMEPLISDEIKDKRYNEIMTIQKEISTEKMKTYIGNEYKVLVEDFDDNYYFGRNEYMAFEVDGYIMIEKKHNEKIAIGTFIDVKIVDSLEYDLVGEVIK